MIQKEVYISVQDHLVTGEKFDLCYDAPYDMLYTTPRPKDEELGRYYESEDYISHTDTKKGLLSFLYQIVKKYSLQKKVQGIHKLNGGTGRLLDIGAGTGAFLSVANNKGWDVSGVEVSDNARSLAEKKNLNLFSAIKDVPGEKFDVITMWHVLEHVSNYSEVLDRCYSLLKDQGHLVIAVPNYKCYDAQYYKNFWAAYDAPRHLWHFSKKSLTEIVKNKFLLVATKPMVFDSFYVSLLSEKYRSGNSFSFHALWIGFLSNLRAMKTKDYSSLIYCFKKTI